MIYTNAQATEFSPKQKQLNINKLKITEIINPNFLGLEINKKCKKGIYKFKICVRNFKNISITGRFLLSSPCTSLIKHTIYKNIGFRHPLNYFDKKTFVSTYFIGNKK